MKEIYIYSDGVLTPIENTDVILCGYYAAVGFNGSIAGDLFAVVSGPRLIPCYDANGKRKNVGADLAGMSYNIRRAEWYNE